MTRPQIRDWYATRKGTPNGIVVEHISANLVPHDYLQEQCDEFINDQGLHLVANDYNADSSRGPRQTNAVHDLFETPFTKPLFIIISCVSNSPSHSQNVLLARQTGAPGTGSPAEWNAAVTQWRAVIDSVQAPPPRLTALGLTTNGALRFTLPGQRGRTNQMLGSSNLMDWTVLANLIGTNGPIIFRDPNALSTPRRFYKLRRL